MGGGSPATNTTEIIDLSSGAPKWQYSAPMSAGRIEMNAVLLPTGKVLALGGSVNDEDSSTASLQADLFDPASQTFTSAGSEAFARLYHSVALLLPDATVWVAGGNPVRGSYESHMEIYRPPYLFTTNANGQTVAATRPAITGAPGAIAYGDPFQVQTPDAASISSVVLIRNGAVTHAFDNDERVVQLQFTSGSGALTVTAPPSGNIAPPGYYMLFLLNNKGVPSVASFVKVSSQSAPDGIIVSPASDISIAAGQTVSFSGSRTSGGNIVSYSWIFQGGTPSSSSVQNPGPVRFDTPGTYEATLTVTDDSGLTDPTPATRTITVVGGFSVSAGATSKNVIRGNAVTYPITVTAGNGFAGTVNFSVSELPPNTTATFAPATINGSGTTTLTVTTNAATTLGLQKFTVNATSQDSAQSLALSMNVADFQLVLSPQTQDIKPGQDASYTLTASAIGGSFDAPISVACLGAPKGGVCAVSPASLTPGNGIASATVKVTTAAASAWIPTRTGTRLRMYAIWLPLLGCILVGGSLQVTGKRYGCFRRRLAILPLLLVFVALTQCGGGGASNPAVQTGTQGAGTPAGNYVVTISATGAGIQHSASATLNVQ
jgi:hypothetical protein